MGTMIQAKCECGFKSEKIFAGGGFMDFMNVLTAPALCTNCYTFTIRSYLAKHNYCKKCKSKITFYNDKSLWKDKNISTSERNCIFYWEIDPIVSLNNGVFRLPDTAYLCPKCREFKMKFYNIGIWD